MGVKVKRHLGERVSDIAEELNLPKVTVERVIREYLKSIEDSVMRGETAVIDSITSIKVKETEEGLSIRGRVSPVLKRKVGVKLEEEREEGEE